MSGQSVSITKSRVYFSPNVDRDTRESLCDILRFASTKSLGKYLGFPIKHPGSSSQDFNFVLDRVKQKLSGWKANSWPGCFDSSFLVINSFLRHARHLLTRENLGQHGSG